jgi:hypothetical protein
MAHQTMPIAHGASYQERTKRNKTISTLEGAQIAVIVISCILGFIDIITGLTKDNSLVMFALIASGLVIIGFGLICMLIFQAMAEMLRVVSRIEDK